MKTKYILFIVIFITSCISPTIAQVNLSGILDLTQTFHDKPDTYDTQYYGDNPFHSIRSRIFLNSWVQENIGVFLEMRLDDGTNFAAGGLIRLEGASIVFKNVITKNFNIKVGRIAHPFGTYSYRTYSNLNPLIGAPLLYSYHTSLADFLYPDNLIQIANKRKSPLTQRLPIVDDSWWNTGIEIFSTYGKVEYALAITNGTVSSPRASQNRGKQIVGRVGFRPAFGLKVGSSYAYGPYLSKISPPYPLPKPIKVTDFHEWVYGFDLEYTLGYFILNAEFAEAKFETLMQEEYVNTSAWYVEGKYKLTPHLYIALRYDQMIFDKIDDGFGTKVPWDYDLIRFEGGLGYKIAKDVVFKIVQRAYRFNNNHFLDENTTAAQLSIFF